MTKHIFDFLRLFLFFIFFIPESQAQAVKISGKIRDAVTREALPFANVIIQNTKRGTSTDRNGKFELTVPQGATFLIVSYMGYKTETIPLKGIDTTLHVNLTPTAYFLQDVNVYANSSTNEDKDISTTQLQSEQIAQIAGMTKDAFRAVQTLPGVSVNNEASARFNVRGGTYEENLVLVNGVRVYEPFHVKEEPLTSIGVFNIDMVRKIDFVSGGFSAEYGDALSSVLNVDYRSGKREKMTGGASLSLLDLGFLLEGPLTANGSWMLGLRKSYFEYVIKLANANTSLHPSFYDVQGQVDYEIKPANKLRLDFIHSGDDFISDRTAKFFQWRDLLSINNEQTAVIRNQKKFNQVDADYFNNLFALKSTNVLSNKLVNESMLSYYSERNGLQAESYEHTTTDFQDKPEYFSFYTWDGKFSDKLYIKTIEGQTSLSYQPTSLHMLKTGIDYQRLIYSTQRAFSAPEIWRTNTLHFPDTTVIVYPPDPQYNDTTNLEVTSFKLAGYAQDNWQVADHLILNIGGRIDYFDMNKNLRWSPRLSLSYRTPFGSTLRAAWGRYYQSPTYKQLKSNVPTKNNTKSQRAVHYIAGFEQKLNERLTLKVEGYYKKYSNLLPVQRLGDGSLDYGKKENSAEGFARGIDVYAGANFPGCYGWISYSLLETKEKLTTNNEGYYSRYTDQRHTLSAVISANLGKNWKFSIRGFYGSGYAYTPYVTVFDSVWSAPRWIPSGKNTEHYPSYERIDVRFGKEFMVAKRPLLFFVDVMNIFNRRNVFSYNYMYGPDGNLTREARLLFPIIPSAGISYSF